MKLIRVVATVIFGVGLLSSSAWAGTAFQTQAIAEKVISPSARGKLIWVRATEDKGVVPSKWCYLFYDAYADQNGRVVDVVNDSVTSVKQGFVELDHARLLSYKPSEVMAPVKLRLDSDRALAAVQNAAKIENVKLSTVHYELTLNQDNDVPTWKLTLYTVTGQTEVKFCTARLSAYTGQIFSLDVDRDKL